MWLASGLYPIRSVALTPPIHSMEPVSKRPTLANRSKGLKFQSSIPMESGLTGEIFARLPSSPEGFAVTRDFDQTETF